MKKIILFLNILILIGCSQNNQIYVSNLEQLNQAIEDAQPGDEIIMKNGVWKDVEIQFTGIGAEKKPIKLLAETSGQVFVEGVSCLQLAGEYLIVEGLYFRNGHSPNRTLIEFRKSKKEIANHCRVTNCVIEAFNQPNRYNHDHWVEFYGQHNQLDHCYIAGKANQGPTIRVYLNGNEHIRNYHKITNNHFGPRPRKGGPKAETMQIGSSNTSMTPSYIQVTNNLFEKCNGEVETISSKSNFNEFRNNIFMECEGSLVMRHGNYCIIDGNIFIGNDESNFIGGIRLINTGHWITNNYFYKLKADEFRSPLAVMNGIPKSPLNRYNQVTDAVVAHNTWIDCKSPWQFSVGCNTDKTDVLPKSEIRSARPIRTVIANNLVYNHERDELPIKTYDKVDGIQFENNIFHNFGGKFEYSGIIDKAIVMMQVSDWLFVPSDETILTSVYNGYNFENIQSDIFGNSRSKKNLVGAISGIHNDFKIDKEKYGAKWFSTEKADANPKIIKMTDEALNTLIKNAGPNDIVEIPEGNYTIEQSLVIEKAITLRAEPGSVNIHYTGKTPLFQLAPRANLKLENITFKGTDSQSAFATLQENMSFPYNLYTDGCEFSKFKQIMKSFKGSMGDTLLFSNTAFDDCEHGIELAAETNDKGDYNAEFVYLKNCDFYNIDKNVLNFYRGGYDESTIGGYLEVFHCKFENCGRNEDTGILLKTHGIINVNIFENSFKSNPVKYVAVLWGEKNNHHSQNILEDSGEIRVNQHLKQKLMY